MNPRQNHFIIPAILITVTALIFIALVVSRTGIVANTFGIGRSSTIVLANLPSETTVYVDNEKVLAEGGTLTRAVAPGDHTILVSENGFWPWSKTVTLAPHDEARFMPFLVSRTPELRLIAPTDQHYTQALQTVAAAPHPTEAAPTLSTDNAAAVWIANNQVRILWRGGTPVPASFCTGSVCDTPRTIFTPETALRSVAFYGARNDVFLVAAGNSIDAIEADTRGTQNFQPLYQGTAPVFARADAHTLYITDEVNGQRKLFSLSY